MHNESDIKHTFNEGYRMGVGHAIRLAKIKIASELNSVELETLGLILQTGMSTQDTEFVKTLEGKDGT